MRNWQDSVGGSSSRQARRVTVDLFHSKREAAIALSVARDGFESYLGATTGNISNRPWPITISSSLEPPPAFTRTPTRPGVLRFTNARGGPWWSSSAVLRRRSRSEFIRECLSLDEAIRK